MESKMAYGKVSSDKTAKTDWVVENAEKGAAAAAARRLGLPANLGLDSLMAWLATKMRDSDADIRSKMADMGTRKELQTELNDLTIALRDSFSGADAGGGYLEVKPPLDNPAGIRNAQWYKALDTNTRSQIDAVLEKIGAPGYRVGIASVTIATADGSGKSTYNKGDWLSREEGERLGGAKAEGIYPVGARMHKDDIERAVASLGDISKSLSSNDEIQMIELQSKISARGQLLQLVSGMIGSFNQNAEKILGNMRT